MFDVKESSYYDMEGNLLWTEPMRFSRLDGVGDLIIESGVHYHVRRVAVAGSVQVVNLQRSELSPGVGKLADWPIVGYPRARRS